LHDLDIANVPLNGSLESITAELNPPAEICRRMQSRVFNKAPRSKLRRALFPGALQRSLFCPLDMG
jgi:hypothetical protein